VEEEDLVLYLLMHLQEHRQPELVFECRDNTFFARTIPILQGLSTIRPNFSIPTGTVRAVQIPARNVRRMTCFFA